MSFVVGATQVHDINVGLGLFGRVKTSCVGLSGDFVGQHGRLGAERVQRPLAAVCLVMQIATVRQPQGRGLRLSCNRTCKLKIR